MRFFRTLLGVVKRRKQKHYIFARNIFLFTTHRGLISAYKIASYIWLFTKHGVQM